MTSRRGGNAIEFALVLPVLLALVTGIMDYALVFNVRNVAMAAARAGARTGSVTPQSGNPESAAADSALRAWREVASEPTPSIVAFRTGSPQLVTVRVTVDVTHTIGFVMGPQRLQVTAVELMEEQP